MSTTTGIEWTNHTFNPWWGCAKVHSGCAFCYAESLDNRWGGKHWGSGPRRMVLGEWGKPHRWNADAAKSGTHAWVFCASMCDLFEDYDGPVVDQRGLPVPMRDQVGNWTVPLLRRRVFRIIEETPNLQWQLLTKRPENVTRMVPTDWMRSWPTNVLTGTSPCDQKTADASIPHLLRIPGRRFLSCEPLLGAIDYAKVPDEWDRPCLRTIPKPLIGDIDWVIVGCESNGKRTRRLPNDTEAGYWDAAASIINQCREAGVPVFHKQAPCGSMVSHDPSEWPEPMRVRQMPTPNGAKQ